MEQISDKLLHALAKAKTITVLTGAGISAESGILTFRGKDGLWNKYDPQELATQEAFDKHPEIVWEWYQFRRDLVNRSQPNPGHLTLAEMEKHYNSFTVITQNVDGLHARGGSSRVLELHGNIHKSRCNRCGLKKDDINYQKGLPIPACDCGGKYRPDVVWFGEMLPQKTLEKAFSAAQASNVFMVIGTASLVYPAAYLPQEAKRSGSFVIEINPASTPLSTMVDASIRGNSGSVLPEIWQGIQLLGKRNA